MAILGNTIPRCCLKHHTSSTESKNTSPVNWPCGCDRDSDFNFTSPLRTWVSSLINHIAKHFSSIKLTHLLKPTKQQAFIECLSTHTWVFQPSLIYTATYLEQCFFIINTNELSVYDYNLSDIIIPSIPKRKRPFKRSKLTDKKRYKSGDRSNKTIITTFQKGLDALQRLLVSRGSVLTAREDEVLAEESKHHNKTS